MKVSSRLALPIAKRLPRGYWPIIRAAADADPFLQDMPIQLRGISTRLRADLRESVFVPLYRTGHIPHQVGFDRVCRELVRPGDTVFDIGANIGYTTALYSDLVRAQGRVVAVEPSPRTFSLLQRSLSCAINVTLLNVGISAAAGELPLYVPATLDAASFIPINGAEKVSIHVITLDQLSARYGQPTCVKVDVEGYEPDVFRGGAQTLGNGHPPILIFEALDDDALQRSIAVIGEIPNTRYRVKRITNGGVLVGPDHAGSTDYTALPPWVHSSAHTNES